jgi:hypothetical protein
LALIRLYVLRAAGGAFPRRFVDEAGVAQDLLRLRLRARILIGRDPDNAPDDRRQSLDGIVDTGAPLTVFPRHVWDDRLSRFSSHITRLQFDPDEMAQRPPDQRTPTSVVAGRRFPYFLGRVHLGAFDLEGRRMPAVPVLAMFREDVVPRGEPPPPILLGLGSGILDGRRLVRDPVFEPDESEEPGHETYGQRWWLTDA